MNARHFLMRVARGAGFFFAARVASAVALLGINALLARFISIQELGVYVLFLSIVTIVGTVSAVGFGNTTTRMIAESMRLGRYAVVRKAAWAGFGVSFAVSLGLALLCFGWPLPDLLEIQFQRPMSPLEGLLAGTWLVSFAVRYAGGYVYRGMQVMGLAAIYQGMGANFVVIALLAALYYMLGQGSVLITLAVMAAAALVTTVSCWVGIWQRLARLPPDDQPVQFPWRAFLGRGSLMSLPTLFQTNGREVCVWIVGATAGLTEVALFGAANRLMQVVALPVVVTNQVMQPFIAEFQAAGDLNKRVRELRLSTAIVFVIMLGMVVGIALVGQWGLTVIYRPEFAAAYPILLWLALGRLVQGFFGPAFAVLSMTGHEPMLARDAFLQFLCLTGFGLLAGYLFGAVGVAVVFCLTLTSFAVLRTLTVRRRLGFWLMPDLNPWAMIDLLRAAIRKRGGKGRARQAERATTPIEVETIP